MSGERLRQFLAGARDTIPMMVGAAPFGLIFGTLAAAGPLALWHGQAMSLAVFAGSSQFIALGLVASGAGLLLIWFTTFIVNLRHVLYAANLLPHVAHLAPPWRWLLGFLLTDETFAVVANHFARVPRDPLGQWYFLGSGLPMYVNWQAWTFVGLLFGASFPELSDYGLEFAMPATFIAIVVPQLKTRPHLAAALVAGLAAWLLRGLPYQLGLLTAVLAGVAIGLLLSRRAPAAEEQA